ncbi:MAG: YceI family protein [Flavobacteriales bacterium]|nr:YceI family protein [Flavobacteriales bacterium]
MKRISIVLMAVVFISTIAFKTEEERIITKTGHISFYSHTIAEDIVAHNYKVMSAFTPSTGAIVFSVPMQSFEFKKAMMQKHYNSPKFLNTKAFPKAKFKGNIDGKVPDFSKDGKYEVSITGHLTMHGVTKQITQKGLFEVGGGVIKATSKFDIVLAEYEVAFKSGKAATNIAKEVAVTIDVSFKTNKKQEGQNL